MTIYLIFNIYKGCLKQLVSYLIPSLKKSFTLDRNYPAGPWSALSGSRCVAPCGCRGGWRWRWVSRTGDDWPPQRNVAKGFSFKKTLTKLYGVFIWIWILFEFSWLIRYTRWLAHHISSPDNVCSTMWTFDPFRSLMCLHMFCHMWRISSSL